ncbi:hypothetical protein cand_016710 [Cryptosporidium andersoni]|uniref:Uncharacterized protein n=1 Tax=Cryptosporidium andersoni TaxID=117008 RepID=A0A1J4MTV8_9CRYT|nr:hypothetical protein cand_016710 [Cryptosporidium andersoni]
MTFSGRKTILSSSWAHYRKFTKLYSGGDVMYCQSSGILLTLCDGCILASDICKSPFVLGSIGPYNDTYMTTEHAEEVSFFACNDLDNSTIVTIGARGIFRSWSMDVSTVELSEEKKVKFSFIRSWRSVQKFVNKFCFDKTGQYIACGSSDGSIKVYDSTGGFVTHSFTCHKSAISNLKFHSSRWLLFSSCINGVIGIHDLTINKTILKSEDQHFGVINSIELINTITGSLGGLVTAGSDNIINIWDLDQLKDSGTLGILSSNPESAPKKKKSKKSSEYNKLIPIKQIHSPETVFSILCCNTNLIADYKDYKCPWVIITGNEKTGLTIWDPVSGETLRILKCNDYGCTESIVSNIFMCRNQDFGIDSNKNKRDFLILTMEDRRIVVLNFPDFTLYTILLGETPDIIQAKFLINKDQQESDTNEVKENSFGNIEGASEKEYQEDELVYSSSSNMIEKNLQLRCIILNSTEVPTIMSLTEPPFKTISLLGHTSTVLSTDVSECCRFIATSSKDETIRIWDTKDGFCLLTLSGHTDTISSVAFQRKKFIKGPNSKFFVFSGSRDKTLKSWNIGPELTKVLSYRERQNLHISNFKVKEQGYEVKNIIVEYNVIAHNKDINHICISHNNKIIATCSEDKTIKLWSFPDIELIGTCKGHLRGVWQCSFSPIDKVIASASADGTIKLWNIDNFMCIKTFQGHDSPVLQVSFLQNGLQLVSSADDGLVKLWNISTSECIATFSGHKDKIWTLDIFTTPQYSFMLTGGADSQIILWEDITSKVEEQKKLTESLKNEKITQVDVLIKQNNWIEALNLALDLNLQLKTFQALEKILQPKFNHFFSSKSLDGSYNLSNYQDKIELARIKQIEYIRGLKEWFRQLSVNQIAIILKFTLEWVTIPKTVWLANTVMIFILCTINPSVLYKVEGFTQISAAFRAYNEKYKSRWLSLDQKAYLLDYLFLPNQFTNNSITNKDINKDSSELTSGIQSAFETTLNILFNNDQE